MRQEGAAMRWHDPRMVVRGKSASQFDSCTGSAGGCSAVAAEESACAAVETSQTAGSCGAPGSAGRHDRHIWPVVFTLVRKECGHVNAGASDGEAPGP